MSNRRRVLLVFSNPGFRDGLFSRLIAAGCQVEACEGARKATPKLGDADVMVLDLWTSDEDAVDFARRVRTSLQPRLPILALGGRGDDERFIAMIRAGAIGCLYTDDAATRLPSAIEDALAGGHPMSRGMGAILLEHVRRQSSPSSPSSLPTKSVTVLTERERTVLTQLARGLLYEDIGKILGVSVNTVRSFIRTIYGKLEVNSRTEAVLVGIKLGLIRGTPYPRTRSRPR
jgi:DNA-binding NarL/FixJ family response regulator